MRHILSQEDQKPIAKFIYENLKTRETAIEVQKFIEDLVAQVEQELQQENREQGVFSQIESTKNASNRFYVKETSCNNMKLTLHRHLQAYTVTKISKDALKFKISW